jgi:two-component system NtrC family sensor kinase
VTGAAGGRGPGAGGRRSFFGLFGSRVPERDEELERQRARVAELEKSVALKTSEAADAQRVLRRMWWLGQQVTLELTPQRVLDRFLEAVTDIVQADGALVGLLGEDARIKLSAAAGVAQPLAGQAIPVVGSLMGTVIRTGKPAMIGPADFVEGDTGIAMLDLLRGSARAVGMIPVSRRGERIGVVVIAPKPDHLLTPADLDRVEAMADLLSVSLENAELVETLRQTEWRFRTLFRAAPDAVLTVLQSGRIREANDAVRELTQCDPYQVIGREIIDLVAETDRSRFGTAMETAFGGQAQRIEVSFGATERRVVALAITRLPEADPPTLLIVGRDMTSDREMRARLRESDRLAAVGELVAGVAHEVNNPLSSISAFAQLLLRDGGLTPEQRDSIEVIKAETLRASQVVKDLLAFARRSEPLREAIDLNAIIARTLRLRDYQLTSNKIKVEQNLGGDLPAVIGDGRQLQQVCLNLVTNAIQAMATLGGGTLFVTTRATKAHVILEMRDTGPGIPEAVRAHVFEPFYTTKSEGEGTGLGLSVSYGIVTAHGGQIEIADSSGAGTTFRLTLPAAETEAPAEPGGRISGPVGIRSAISGIRLLFVDDEPLLRSGMQAYGDLRGFAVITAADGIEALSVVRNTGVDAVVCDVRMPGMDGIAFHERLRHDRPGLAARTVFITGDVVSPTGRTAAARQPVVHKPFTFERLEDAITAVVRGVPFGNPPVRPKTPPWGIDEPPRGPSGSK